MRSALVVAQVAIAVVVLAGGLLLTHSLLRLLHVDTGRRPDRLLTFNVQFIDSADRRRARGVRRQRARAAAALPGIDAVGGATGLSPITAQRGTTFEVEGQPDVARRRLGRAVLHRGVSWRTSTAIGTRMVAGREFAAADAARRAAGLS